MSGSDKTLTVDTADTVTEISVLDGNLNPVAAGVGGLSAELPAGLYKVRVRTGPTVDERLVSLDADRNERFETQLFPSPVPLTGTSLTHEYHIAAAREASAHPRVALGSGATIFVFAREWSHPAASNPAAGLRLLDVGGRLLANLEELAEVRIDTDKDPSAGCSIAVDPGQYRLRLEHAEGGALERALPAVKGCQTQIFMLQRDDGTARRPDLEAGAVVMSNRGTFEPNNDLARLSALARYALTQHRKISDQLRQILAGKLEDPMLGLFGAHLIARDYPDDHALFDNILNNLKALLGSEHPDVQALALRSSARSDQPIEEFSIPPMLRASWDMIVEATLDRRAIVLTDSPAGIVAQYVVPSLPWLTWRGATGDSAASASEERRDPRMVALADYIQARRLLADLPQFIASSLSSLETMTETPELDEIAGLDRLQGAEAVTKPPELDEDAKAELARNFGVPHFVLEAMLRKLRE